MEKLKKQNHVGRPTNEEVEERRKKSKNKIIIFSIMVIFIVLGGIYLFVNRDNINLSSILGNSSTKDIYYVNSSSKFESVLKYTPSTESNAVQGAVVTDNMIFFATSKAGGTDVQVRNSKMYSYNRTTGVITELTKYSNYFNNNQLLNDHIIGDMTIRDDKLYVQSFSSKSSTNPISNYYYENSNGIQNLTYGSNNNKLSFSALAYSKEQDNFYALYAVERKLRLYEHKVVSSGENYVHKGVKGFTLDTIPYADAIASQGIAIDEKYLYLVAQIKSTGTNYLFIYDFATGIKNGNKVKIKLLRKVSLGRTDTRYQVQNVSIVNGKVYLGYSNKSYNSIIFYKLNITIDDLLNGSSPKAKTSSTSSSSKSNSSSKSSSSSSNAKKAALQKCINDNYSCSKKCVNVNSYCWSICISDKKCRQRYKSDKAIKDCESSCYEECRHTTSSSYKKALAYHNSCISKCANTLDLCELRAQKIK